ncbi:conserved hypothetical protein [Gloeothece citriformis PCC 7424]|uniref:AAA+ ATPase domain-containing protein n=1 Tax=Gloeothece citriformis (strain PCC 7424) TaxID=65393 RepID=B7KHN5_GLOC7|nr:ATP-binding protein [Gloeothece citriformis]ACK70730.1 conserved hypothetical protein [Gloeothece citriformis PCC 7424]
MSDLITELCQLTAKILQDNPQASLAELVALVKTKINTNFQLSESIQNDSRLIQINQGDAKGFQTLITGGTANIGIFANDINQELLQEVLQKAISSFNWELDIHKLQEHGNYILEGEIKSTINGVHIKRPDILAQLISLAETSNFVFVTGERGSGKSSLIKEFTNHVKQDVPIFCFRTTDFNQSHLDAVFSTIGLKSSLQDLETGLALIAKKYLIIESLEKLLELENKTAFTDLLHFINKQQGWTVIATGRNYAYQPIIFTYLQPNKIKFETLTLKGFNDEDIQQLCEQITSLKTLSSNVILKELIKCPFYADLAYRVLQTGIEFTPDDGEKEFRTAVWQNVIAKEQERNNGMPLKRRKTFIEIAVKRAKKMVSGIPRTQDSEALNKLEEDNLIRRDSKNLVSPGHDIFEDWAIEKYIEEIYQEDSDNIQKFLDTVGHEPAMNRAFRLWLHQKLRDGDNIDDWVYTIVRNQNIQRCWQDETIAAVLQGDNPDKFLRKLKNQLFTENGELLKRFCFILRIACKTPLKIDENNQSNSLDILWLEPHGRAWEVMIQFLYKNRELLSTVLLPHIVAVLHDWSSILNINEDLPLPSREAGLLALYLLDDLKDSYRDDGNRTKLLSIIIKTIPAIRQEFLTLLETDIFISKRERQKRELCYVKDFCEMIFLGIETAFFSKYAPEIIIKLASFEWFIEEYIENNKRRYRNIDVDECFGIHKYRYDFSPASGAKGTFKYLLDYHWKQGLDFILNLFNISADKYAHSDLDSPRQSSYLKIGYSEPLIETIEIELNDGSKKQQYCSWRLWEAYRGFSVIPDLLQSALMALENWLIACAETFEAQQIELLFDYILQNSNSVMPTAVLASVATGFPKKVGKAALPLLRNPELYHMDRSRAIDERGSNEINWHRSLLRRDALSKLYSEERRTAALRPWRQQHLETLVLQLQFSELRDEVLVIVDKLHESEPKDELMRFFLNRIDSRNFQPVADSENNRTIYYPPDLEPDLKQIQQKTLEKTQKLNRYLTLKLWSDKKSINEPVETEYFSTWQEAFSEAKYWDEQLKSGQINDSTIIDYGAVVTSASICIRDYHQELDEPDIDWCIEIIIKAVVANSDTNNELAILDKTDYAASALAASILPILFDFISTDDDKLILKKIIAIALTHVNQNVRHQAAEGIRKYLWQRDPEFAQQCIIGAIEYARFENEQKHRFLKRQIYALEGESKIAELNKLLTKKNEFREQFAQGQLLSDINAINFQSHGSWDLLSPSLMIPDGSREPSHILLLSRMLTLFFEYEQEKNNREYRHNNTDEMHYEVPYKLPYDFGKRFAEYLFYLHDSNFQDYIELLKIGCEKMPIFINTLLLQVAVLAERKGEKQIYWQLWQELSQTVQNIALKLTEKSFDRQESDKRQLIRGMLHTDSPWSKIDYENQDIALGKDLILEFVENAGKNSDIFESLASLMYHFPSIFCESGLPILSNHQKEEESTRLLSRNTAFYLEMAIQRFLQAENTGSLPKKLHESCFILLNAIIETASSRAYYLREHLIRSVKIL